ncbi:MAG: Pyrophosphatase PpaX [Bacteroidia bacterium]|nr:Pyrophosphatase PpaX [Bacteroidia bacterium]
MKYYKHFIFDFDGVISDSYELAVEKFNEIRDEFFPLLPKVETKNDMAIVYAGALKTCLNKWIGQEGTKAFFNHHSERMQAVSENIKPFYGIIETLNTLGDKKVSIVTSSYSEAVRNILTKDATFNENAIYKIAGRELQQSKTEKIFNLLKDLNIKKEDAVYVGDLESDILYCRDVPIDIISVGYGYHPSEYLQSCKPTYFAASVNELKNLLTIMNSNN